MNRTTPRGGRGPQAIGNVHDETGHQAITATDTTPAGPVVGGRWRIVRILGQGGMSDVFAAVDETGGLGSVAVKIVRSSDPALARRMAEEARALRSFDHPNLVRLLSAGIDRGQAYLVTELVDGPTLAARLHRGPLVPARTAALGRGLAAALEYVHGRGVVHRDIKPANVLLGRDHVRLADFGIARLLDAASMTLTGTTLGTAAYMAPEQIEHHGVGPAADIWSLGMTLLECLTGRPMFVGTPAEVIAQRLATVVQLPPGLPAPWRVLVAAMLDPVPSARPVAAEVAGMIGAPAFETPLARPLVDGGPPGPARTGAVGNGTGGEAADESVPPPRPVPAPSPSETLVGDRTMHAPTGLRFRPPTLSWLRRFRVPLVVGAFIAIALIAWAATGTDGPRPRAGAVAPKQTTTTTAPGVAQDAGTLERDIQQGIGSRTISPSVGEQLLTQLNQVILAVDELSAGAAASGLGTIDALVGSGASSGSIAPGEASRLATDVSALSGALKITDIATTTTTTAPPVTTTLPENPGPPGHAKGGGPGGRGNS